jgi:chromosome segregation ATPase
MNYEYYELYNKCKNIKDHINKLIEIKNGINYFNTNINRYNIQIKLLTNDHNKCERELEKLEASRPPGS